MVPAAVLQNLWNQKEKHLLVLTRATYLVQIDMKASGINRQSWKELVPGSKGVLSKIPLQISNMTEIKWDYSDYQILDDICKESDRLRGHGVISLDSYTQGRRNPICHR